MTTNVIVQAHCGTDKEVAVSVNTSNTGENHILQDGEEQTFYAYDEQEVTVKERAKQET